MPLRETIDRIRTQPVPPNEESTKLQAVAPILDDLGWDPVDPDRVRYEYDAGGKKRKRRVDVALMGEPHASPGRHGILDDDHVVAFIEVKAPGQRFDDHLDQVLEYAFRVGVDICALTDGLKWWLYLPREKGPPESRRFEVIDMKSDSTERVATSLEAYLLRRELLAHRSEKRAKEALRSLRDLEELRERIPQIWSRMWRDADPELVELVKRRVHAETRLRPARELIVSVLRDEPVPSVTAFPGAPATGPVGEHSLIDDTKPIGGQRSKKKSRRSSRPKGFRLWGKRQRVATHREILLGVARVLYERHWDEFDKVLELRGTKFPFFSRSRDELRDARAIKGSPYFIEVAHLTAKSIERRCHQLLKLFGYRSRELELLFD